MRENVIRPGQPWHDTHGNRIQAHGGSILFEDDVFYWYGENKERTETLPAGTGVWHWGMRCYSSADLINWEDRGLIIPPHPDDPDSPLHPHKLTDRPHIIRNPRTGKYVCWLKIMNLNDTQTSTVLVADSLLGPYEMVATDLRPAGMSAGDFDLVVNPGDGKGYYYFERPHRELICADLTDDYLDVTGYYSTHFPLGCPPAVREAPAYFWRDGKHYLITSGTTGYFPNPSQVAVADSFHGPWTMLGDPHPGDTTRTSYRSQVSSVFRHPGKRDLYIALGDRWLPRLTAEQSNQEEGFRRIFAGEPAEVIQAETPEVWGHADTSIADYVWLPISFDGGIPRIDWRDEWSPEDFD
jgi:hypothetical protein